MACFTDQENDPESGLMYYGARYYDPWVGRFLSQDPALIGDEAGLTFDRISDDPQNFNAYSYVLNRPTIMVDENGEVAFLAVPLITGAIGAATAAAGYTVANVSISLASGNSAFSNFSGSELAVATGVGFVAGALAPFVATSGAGAAALGATANVAQTGVNAAISGETVTVTDVAVSAATGALGGAIGGAVTKQGGKIAFEETSSLAKAINQEATFNAGVEAGVSNFSRNVLGATVSNITVPSSDSNGTDGGSSPEPSSTSTDPQVQPQRPLKR